MKGYLAEIAEGFGCLVCAVLNHAGGCVVLRYRTRYWNPIAFLYHWGTDVANDSGRETRCSRCAASLTTGRPVRARWSF